MYQEVVHSSYRLHDLLLQRLIELAGPDTAIVLVSDHGFHSDHLRPKFTPRVPAGITVWHRPRGAIVARGPGFKSDELVHGARLLDVTPTIPHYFGLPVGRDMEGRVLEEAFVERTPVAFIATWERPDRVNRERGGMEDADRKALLDQFVALGYIDEVAAAEDAIEPMDFIIVSGLPRSGTSLMMQLLQAGGLPLMTDGKRGADLDNPEEYWEWEGIKKLPTNPHVIDHAQGKVVKVISALLPSLPAKHRYKIIYMTRPVEQVVASQWEDARAHGAKAQI